MPRIHTRPPHGTRSRIINWSYEGEYLTLRYTDKNGHSVSAAYKRIGWGDPPREVAEEVHRILSNPPTALYGRFNQKRGTE